MDCCVKIKTLCFWDLVGLLLIWLSKKGYEGLTGYLVEYNNNEPRKTINFNEFEIFENLRENELCMRDSLAVVRITTEAATRFKLHFKKTHLN